MNSYVEITLKNTYLTIILSIISLVALPQKAEVVICADLSGSTNGLVISLQKTIWSVVNEIDANNSIDEVKFALVGYGRKSFGKENNFSRVLHDLSIDVNQIGYTLLKAQVTIQGCDAYPEQGINNCINNISWSKEEGVRKIVIIIGNGGIAFKSMEKQIKKAHKKGIKITPIYYKSRNNAGEEKQWKKFSELCNNELRIAVPSNKNIVFSKNYDTNFIQETGEKLKYTYIPYGSEGKTNQKKFNFLFDHLKESSTEGYEEMLVYQSSYHV